MRFLGSKTRFTALLLLAASLQAEESGICRESIVVNVRDHQGQPVADLVPSSFRATVGHSVLKILSASGETSRPRIVLLLDQSGSINKSSGSFEVATRVAGNFVALNAGKAHIAVVLFSDHAISTIGFDTPKNKILQKFSELRDGEGPTAFYDSLIYGATLFGRPEPGDAIYSVTDGRDNRSKSDARDAAHVLLSRGVRLFAFVLSHGHFPTEEGPAGREDLLRLVEMTGGAAVIMDDLPARQSGRLSPVLQPLYEAMESFYRIEIEAPTIEKESRWNMEVLDANGKRRKDLAVSYPMRLTPCVPAHH